MSAGGWIIMLVSVGIMTSLLSWCIFRIVATPASSEHLHSQADIEPDDVDESTFDT